MNEQAKSWTRSYSASLIGNIRQKAEFTLSNRSHLDYQVLVGRNILSDVMLVDVSQANIAPPEVPERVGQ